MEWFLLVGVFLGGAVAGVAVWRTTVAFRVPDFWSQQAMEGTVSEAIEALECHRQETGDRTFEAENNAALGGFCQFVVETYLRRLAEETAKLI